MKTKKIGLKTGLIFSIISFLFSFSIVIPMFSVFPVEILKQEISTIGQLTHFQAGIITILLLFIVCVLMIIYTFRKVHQFANTKQSLKIPWVILIMFLFYFIIHNLVYIIFMGINAFPLDALNTLAGVITFPFSSFFFIVIGYFMDIIWKNNLAKK